MLSILIVDDEPLITWSLGQAFERIGYSVTLAESAEEAGERMSRKGFDVVLTDFRMKGLTGVDLLKKVKADSPGVKVVLMTAYSSEVDRNEALRVGADGFIRKPFNLNDVLGAVDSVLSRN